MVVHLDRRQPGYDGAPLSKRINVGPDAAATARMSGNPPFPRPQIWSFCRGGDDTIFGGNDLGDSRAAAAAGAGARHRVPAGWAGGARQPAIWGRATLAAPA